MEKSTKISQILLQSLIHIVAVRTYIVCVLNSFDTYAVWPTGCPVINILNLLGKPFYTSNIRVTLLYILHTVHILKKMC